MGDNSNNDFTTDGKFDIGKFNDSFNKSKDDTKRSNYERDEYRLKMLSQTLTAKSLSESTISEIIIEIKNTWFYIMDDLLQQKFVISTFTKDNRLFYIGITFVIIAIIMYLYNYFLDDDFSQDQNSNQKVIEKYYIYKNGSPSEKLENENPVDDEDNNE